MNCSSRWAESRGTGVSIARRNPAVAGQEVRADGTPESGGTARTQPAQLPAPLAHLANARHGRYVLTSRSTFAHRGAEWADRIEANRAVAYRIHLDTGRGRWYLTASWQRPVVKTIPLETARARGMVGVDTNADHFAAYHLDRHGNPVGDPHRFPYDLSGTAGHRDAQIRHALTRLINWVVRAGVTAIGIEDLDFTPEKTSGNFGVGHLPDAPARP
jgi:hypothetical protein